MTSPEPIHKASASSSTTTALSSTQKRSSNKLRSSFVIVLAVVFIESCIHVFVNYSYIQTTKDDNDNFSYHSNLDPIDTNEVIVTDQQHLEEPLIREGQHTKPDALFNNVGVYYKAYDRHFHSMIQCVGENFQSDSWKYRSCQFRNLCYDVDSREFLLFQSPLGLEMESKMKESRYDKFISTATSMNSSLAEMSLGSLNLKWRSDISKVKWFPRVISVEDNANVLRNGYYELPGDKVLVPYHSLNGMNPGHLVWDDFLPIYTLISMFDMVKNKDLFLMRFIVDPPLWATCDTKEWRVETCKTIVSKFLPLMGIDPETYKAFNETFMNVTNATENTSIQSNIVCSKYAAAGLGPLSDHGVQKKHGWEALDYETMHNHGRGALLYSFRNYMLSNVGISFSDEFILKKPYKITFSINSSRSRSINFDSHMKALSEYFSSEDVEVRSYKMSSVPLKEQVQIAAESAIYITVNGGGAVTGMFLPKGSCMLVYYQEDGGLQGNRKTHKPAMLDWDLLNNLSYLRMHWIPMKQGSRTDDDHRGLISIIEHELQVISQLHS